MNVNRFSSLKKIIINNYIIIFHDNWRTLRERLSKVSVFGRVRRKVLDKINKIHLEDGFSIKILKK